ncbi:hypothetical protein Tco_0144758 [Tanacetum coccineum]
MHGKISIFLGLQISQSPRGIFINRSKYALESLKKYNFDSCDPVDTPMVEKSKQDEDEEGKAVDPSHYCGMIGTLLYLTASRPYLQFAICMCARCRSCWLVRYTPYALLGSMKSFRDRFIQIGPSNRQKKRCDIQYGKPEYIALSAVVLNPLDEITATTMAYGFNKIPMYCVYNKSAIAQSLCFANNDSKIPEIKKHYRHQIHFINVHVGMG